MLAHRLLHRSSTNSTLGQRLSFGWEFFFVSDTHRRLIKFIMLEFYYSSKIHIPCDKFERYTPLFMVVDDRGDHAFSSIVFEHN